MRLATTLPLLACGLVCSFPQGASARPTLHGKACLIVAHQVAKIVRLNRDDLLCENLADQDGFLVVTIRSGKPAPKDADASWVGSNLVGYYAWHPGSNTVYEWDFAGARPGSPLAR